MSVAFIIAMSCSQDTPLSLDSISSLSLRSCPFSLVSMMSFTSEESLIAPLGSLILLSFLKNLRISPSINGKAYEANATPRLESNPRFALSRPI